MNATLNSVPPTGNPAVAVLTMTLPNSDLAVTALNYGHTSNSVDVDLTLIPPGITATSVAGQLGVDIISNSSQVVSSNGHLNIDLNGISGRTLVIHRVTQPGTPLPPPPPRQSLSPAGSAAPRYRE
jgi:hypothetical protein